MCQLLARQSAHAVGLREGVLPVLPSFCVGPGAHWNLKSVPFLTLAIMQARGPLLCSGCKGCLQGFSGDFRFRSSVRGVLQLTKYTSKPNSCQPTVPKPLLCVSPWPLLPRGTGCCEVLTSGVPWGQHPPQIMTIVVLTSQNPGVSEKCHGSVTSKDMSHGMYGPCSVGSQAYV